MILVFGATGQVGRALARDPRVRALPRTAADLTHPGTAAAAIHANRPAAVINAAAWTAVDRAETEPEAANRINAAAPGEMALACRDLDIPLVHLSTDYVFDGGGTRPWRPEDAAAPLGAYGAGKLAGERAVQAAGCAHLILRTSWVFSADGTNFVRTMLRLGRERAHLNVVADQIGGPTPAADIAAACLVLAAALIRDPGRSGIQHLSGTPEVSWADFARTIMAEAGLPCQIHDITTADYPTPARRPANSRLDCSGLAGFGIARPDWRAGLKTVLNQLQRDKT